MDELEKKIRDNYEKAFENALVDGEPDEEEEKEPEEE